MQRCTYISTMFNKLPVQFSTARNISLSGAQHLKKIEVKTKDNITTIEGRKLKPTDDVLLLDNPEGFCPTCPEKLGFKIDYTDVLVLSQFVSPSGELFPKEVTGLCNKAHGRMKILIHKAQRAGLMGEFKPNLGGKEFTPRENRVKWKNYNTFFKREGITYRF